MIISAGLESLNLVNITVGLIGAFSLWSLQRLVKKNDDSHGKFSDKISSLGEQVQEFASKNVGAQIKLGADIKESHLGLELLIQKEMTKVNEGIKEAAAKISVVEKIQTETWERMEEVENLAAEADEKADQARVEGLKMRSEIKRLGNDLIMIKSKKN